jgi:hypothetical protein
MEGGRWSAPGRSAGRNAGLSRLEGRALLLPGLPVPGPSRFNRLPFPLLRPGGAPEFSAPARKPTRPLLPPMAQALVSRPLVSRRGPEKRCPSLRPEAGSSHRMGSKISIALVTPAGGRPANYAPRWAGLLRQGAGDARRGRRRAGQDRAFTPARPLRPAPHFVSGLLRLAPSFTSGLRCPSSPSPASQGPRACFLGTRFGSLSSARRRGAREGRPLAVQVVSRTRPGGVGHACHALFSGMPLRTGMPIRRCGGGRERLSCALSCIMGPSCETAPA